MEAILSQLRLLLFSAVVLSSGCATTLPPYDYAREPNPRVGAYELGSADQLLITVWRNPNLTTEATIRPDGTITMPLIGDLRAAGRTSQQLRDEIKAKLQAYVVDANVTVAVRSVNSYAFTVSGNVARTGLFSVTRYVTVSEAVAMAGGPTRFASDVGMIIRRGANGKLRRIPFSYTQVVSGEGPEQNLVVLSGDTIYLP